MKTNESTADRIVRVIVGAVLLVVGLVLVKGGLGIVIDVVGVVLLVTGIIGFCPLYALFHISSSKKA